MRRRAVLSVPASDTRKLSKAWALDVDEVVVDLEDSVSIDEKDGARANVAHLGARPRAGGVAVRVNALGTRWVEEDIATCVANPHVRSIVLPKVEDAEAIVSLAARLDSLENDTERADRLLIQALIESPRGVQQVSSIAASNARLEGLIIGYADLSASLGRHIDAPWHGIQDLVLVAARSSGVQAIDGPLLTVAADEALEHAATAAQHLGFDGKWVIHPAQVTLVQSAFTPTDEELSKAREILGVMEAASREGRGAVAWRGRMLDEAIAVRARRTVDRAGDRE